MMKANETLEKNILGGRVMFLFVWFWGGRGEKIGKIGPIREGSYT